jgi:hypothetical protein
MTLLALVCLAFTISGRPAAAGLLLWVSSQRVGRPVHVRAPGVLPLHRGGRATPPPAENVGRLATGERVARCVNFREASRRSQGGQPDAR